MKKHSPCLLSRLALAALTFLVAGYAFAGANFDISVLSGTKLPTTAPDAAYFAVTNLSSVTLRGYTVAGLSDAVEQDSTTVVPPGTTPTCSNPIVLNPQNTCILILNITKTVNGQVALCNGPACTNSGIVLNVVGKA